LDMLYKMAIEKAGSHANEGGASQVVLVIVCSALVVKRACCTIFLCILKTLKARLRKLSIVLTCHKDMKWVSTPGAQEM